jgi:hypothetical protein
MAIPTLVVGAIAFKKSQQLGGVGRGMAIGGIACAAIGGVIAFLWVFVYGAFFTMGPN